MTPWKEYKFGSRRICLLAEHEVTGGSLTTPASYPAGTIVHIPDLWAVRWSPPSNALANKAFLVQHLHASGRLWLFYADEGTRWMFQ